MTHDIFNTLQYGSQLKPHQTHEKVCPRERVNLRDQFQTLSTGSLHFSSLRSHVEVALTALIYNSYRVTASSLIELLKMI